MTIPANVIRKKTAAVLTPDITAAVPGLPDHKDLLVQEGRLVHRAFRGQEVRSVHEALKASPAPLALKGRLGNRVS